jgi:hypothetical protein
MLDQVMSVYVRLFQVYMLSYDRSGLFRLGEIRSGYVNLIQVRSG